MKQIALILAGCGHQDGSEITEVVSTLIALSSHPVQYHFYSPNIDFHPVNHITRQVDESQKRNLMTETARITRGQIKDLKDLNVDLYDAVIIPGGSGAASHFSTWSKEGARGKVLPELQKILEKFHEQSKPIGLICIAPTLAALMFGKEQVTLTLGDQTNVISEVEKTGAIHEVCPVDDYITDREHKVITTPAYMHDAKPHEIFKGISGLVNELVEMA